MEDTSRRDLFKIIGTSAVLTTAGSGVLSPALAQHVHEAAAESKAKTGGAYVPKGFNRHNYETLKKLSGLVIPADEHSPGAIEAGTSDFIDFLASRNAELAAIFNGGFAWLDNYMKKTYGSDFLSAKPEQQTALLDKLAYKANNTPEVAPGVPFFTWVRNMTVDAYYTSPIGVKDVGYKGNGAMSVFSVPKEAVDYVMKRSPFANEA